jgi:hypothetical protein
VALQVGLRLIGASPGVIITVSFLLALLVGFEAATLRRFTLSRRRWSNVGVVVGDDLESAERRFFDAWVDKSWTDPSAANPSAVDGGSRRSFVPGMATARRPQDSSEVLGLFPQPGASR